MIPDAAAEVLGAGRLCHLAAGTGHGPHVTPVVFVLDGGRVWATTSRGAVKARAWRRDPAAAGLVRHGRRAVVFRGAVTAHDALDPATWPAVARRAPAVLRAWVRFSVKNARYFAGYARDAHRVPLAWTPPARVAVAVEPESGAVLDLASGTVVERWGGWGVRAAGRTSFRPAGGEGPYDREVPDEVRRALGSSGEGALGVWGLGGPVVLPVRWARAASEGACYAVLPRAFLALAGTGSTGRAALSLDRAPGWRASRARGLLLQGDAEAFLPGGVRIGREDLLARARRAGAVPPDPAVVRLRPGRVVWWKGWSSGTVGRR